MNQHLSPEATTPPIPTSTTDYDIHFLYEMGRFRFSERSWLSKMGLPKGMVATDVEHTYSGNAIALLLAKRMGLSDAEIFYLCFMFQFHDIGEVRTGDDDPNSKDYVEVDERRAVEDIFRRTPLYDMVMRAYDEYKARKTIIARIAKAADIIDSLRELLELKAKGVPYIDRIPTRIADKRQCLIDLNLPEAVHLFEQFLTAGHEVIWDHFLIYAESTFTTGQYGK